MREGGTSSARSLPQLHPALEEVEVGDQVEVLDRLEFEDDGEVLFRDTGEGIGVMWGDFDLDGDLDLYHSRGDNNNQSNQLFRNDGGGSFVDATAAPLDDGNRGRGVAWGDYDGDGDLDLYVENGWRLAGAEVVERGRNVLYRNPGFDRNALEIELIGVRSNRLGVGARVRVEIVEDGRRRAIYRQGDAGGSFGGNPHVLHIGVGKARFVESLEVYWPASGIRQTFRNLPAAGRVVVTEGVDQLGRKPDLTVRRPPANP